MKRVAVLDDYQGEVLSLPYWRRLQGRAAIDHFRDTLHDDRALAERLKPYQILVPIRERTRFSTALLQQLPALELLAITGRNSGHVDVKTATARGVLVSETGSSGPAAIELTMGLIIATVRGIPQEDRALRAGRWQQSIGIELAGRTLGVVGLGRIGGKIAAFGRLLGMRVLAWGPTLTAERATAAGADYVPLETLLKESDVVTLHTRLSDLTRGLITARHLALMKPTAYLINTARGPIVDEAALVTALRERRIAGAGLDVFDVEPIAPDHPLLALDNVVLTPHIGYVTHEAYDVFFREVVEHIEQYLDGKVPDRTLNPEALDKR
ncbi:MAG: D-2-hydroxyacid dehydrogenase family protein [Candidatus Rokubacteria bacterium]|nr:D-2-hydroxyacid dehydrogenase family protein [Candidatus Rokubacteria bacterium]